MDWASRIYAGDAPSKVKALLEAIQGRCRFGPSIAGNLDLAQYRQRDPDGISYGASTGCRFAEAPL